MKVSRCGLGRACSSEIHQKDLWMQKDPESHAGHLQVGLRKTRAGNPGEPV